MGYVLTMRPRFLAKILPALVLALALLLAHSAPAAPPLFPPDHPWNQRITSAPVAPNSAAIMNNIITRYGNGALHPDFGQASPTSGADLYGIPYNVVHGNTTGVSFVTLGIYANQSDAAVCPFPSTVVLEGDFQNGPRVGLANRGDSHALVWDWDNNTVYELFSCSRPSENPSNNRWHADQETVWAASTNNFRTREWTSADAAGLSILAGLARPDEALPVAQGGAGVITHALRFTLQNAIILNQYIYPASHVANPGNTNPSIQPPMGARFRLKAGVNISGLSPQSRIVAQALKDYGLILADNGSNFFITGASFSPTTTNAFGLTWSDADIQSTTTGLKSLHFSDFEVVSLTPIVTGLSPAIAPAGSTITVIGQNFSGAAGQLKVLFGSTASTSITYVDDSHITALVPSGSGTVDVRVQSGITTPAEMQNINTTIFGYGLSAVSTADRFTYSAASIVCCRGATCAIVAPGACTVASGLAGASTPGATACNASGNALTPCCLADYNKSGALTVQDIFDFLNDWFASSPYSAAGAGPADPLTVQNIFTFLNMWFAGCP